MNHRQYFPHKMQSTSIPVTWGRVLEDPIAQHFAHIEGLVIEPLERDQTLQGVSDYLITGVKSTSLYWNYFKYNSIGALEIKTTATCDWKHVPQDFCPSGSIQQISLAMKKHNLKWGVIATLVQGIRLTTKVVIL